MSKKTTRKAMLTSVVALVICFAMLVGTTYAWFTDSVASSGNIIKSGTLNIDLLIKTDADQDYVSVKGTPDKKAFNYELWEPGYTEWVNAKVATTGNLALKYTMKIIANGQVSALADVIDVYYKPAEVALPATRDLSGLVKIGTLADALAGTIVINDTLIPGAPDTNGVTAADFATLALHMQESAGNEYQNLSIGTDFSLQILATQYTYEEDSFNDQYDALAKYDIKSAPMAHTAAGETLSIDSADGSKNVSIGVPGAAAEPGHDLQVVLGDPIATTTTEGTTVDLDISLIDVTTGEKVTANADYTVTISGVGTGLAITSLKHNGEEITSFTYDSVNGTITFVTNSFSPFSYSYVDIPDAVHVKTEAQLKAAVVFITSCAPR